MSLYHSASLSVADSLIASTQSQDHAAVQVEALRTEDASTLFINAETRFEDNAADLEITGNVQHEVLCDFKLRLADDTREEKPVDLF